jgi:hypothetical protein
MARHDSSGQLNFAVIRQKLAPYSSLPDSPVTVDELADADVVAVTHAGYDHRAQAIDVTLAGNAVLV